MLCHSLIISLCYICIRMYCVSLQEHLVGLTERSHLYIGNSVVCMSDLKSLYNNTTSKDFNSLASHSLLNILF